jgi:hypothetical protein
VSQAVSLFVHTDQAALATGKNFKFEPQLEYRDTNTSNTGESTRQLIVIVMQVSGGSKDGQI